MPSAATSTGSVGQVLEHVALAQCLPLRLVGPLGHAELGGGACQVGVVGPDLPEAYVVPTGGQAVELEAYGAPEVVAGLRPVVLLQGAVPDRDRHPLGRSRRTPRPAPATRRRRRRGVRRPPRRPAARAPRAPRTGLGQVADAEQAEAAVDQARWPAELLEVVAGHPARDRGVLAGGGEHAARRERRHPRVVVDRVEVGRGRTPLGPPHPDVLAAVPAQRRPDVEWWDAVGVGGEQVEVGARRRHVLEERVEPADGRGGRSGHGDASGAPAGPRRRVASYRRR